MKLKKEIVDNKGFWIFSGILVACFLWLTYLFPYSLDDWAWSGPIGQQRLDTWFENYNGRYLGNLAIILISKFKLIKMVVMAASFYLLCYIPYRCSGDKRLTVLAFSTFMFLCMPKVVFIQVVAWASGYTNYMLPMLVVLGYYLIVKNVFKDAPPKYSIFSSVLALVLGFMGCLFMENVTIYTVVCSIALIVYTFIKFKKVYLNHIAYFVGTVIGAYTMFSNSAYTTIAAGGDDYRSTPTGLVELVKKVLENSRSILNQFFYQNMLALIICSVLSILLVLVAYKTLSKKVKTLSLASVFINVISLSVLYLRYKTDYWRFFYRSGRDIEITTVIFAFFVVLNFLSHLVNFIVAVKGETRQEAIFFLFSIPLIIAPLLVVSPVSARCFYPPYLFLHYLCVILFARLIKELNVGEAGIKVIATSTISVIMAFLFFYVSMYGIIHHYDVKRGEYIEKQLKNGEQTIVCCRLPYEPFVHGGYPTNQLWKDRYKLYFGIDGSKTVEYKVCLEFDEWAEKYDKEKVK